MTITMEECGELIPRSIMYLNNDGLIEEISDVYCMIATR